MSSLETSITLEDVFTVVEAKRVPLAPELAGYLTLEIADGTDAGSGDVEPRTVFISEEGTVALVRPKKDAIAGNAEASVRALLAKLLEASGSGTPALTTAAKRRPGNGLPALVEELEAALIPVNRAAGRRALARLVREVKRVLLGVGRNASAAPVPGRPEPRASVVTAATPARPALRKREDEPPPDSMEPAQRSSDPEDGANAVDERVAAPLTADAKPDGAEATTDSAAPPVAGSDEVDSLLESFGVSSAHEDKQMARELKAIAGLSPTPPPPDAKTLAELTKDIGKDLSKKREASGDGDGVEALLASADASGPLPFPSAAGAPTSSKAAASPPGPRATEKRLLAEIGAHPPRAPKTSMAVLVVALLALIGATVAVWRFAPQIFTGKTRPPASTTSTLSGTPKCKVALVLTGVPSNAEILLRVGQAPVDVERMPVGTRLELIATAEGYAPRRAIIKGESRWDEGPDGKPRIEVPIQLEPSEAKPGAIEPWPATEPGSPVGGSGAPGTVHVVSNVRGAEVWLLAGRGPQARIDQLRCDSDIDVLFAGPPSLRTQRRITEKEIAGAAADAAGNKVVHINAEDPAK